MDEQVQLKIGLETDSLINEIKNLTNEIKAQTKGIGDSIQNNIEKGVDGTKPGQKISREMAGEAKSGGSEFAKVFGANLLAGLASSGIQAGIQGILGGAMKGFTLAGDFQSQLSNIKALTGSTAAEMEKIKNVALQAGKDTAFSALEAAQGLEELLKAGLNAEQAQIGLKGALDLAAAGGIEVADAAEIASTALNAFKNDGLSVEQSADILAGAANASATSVGELKFGLSQVSAVASGAGMSFKDTNTALAVFASNGLKGSDAGTSLKTMLMNLQPTTDAQRMLFAELGLQTLKTEHAFETLTKAGFQPASKSVMDINKSLSDYTKTISKSKVGTAEFEKDMEGLANGMGFYQNQFFTAEGKVKDLASISGELKNALKDMTDEQRLAALETLFGSDAIRAANILYKEGAEGINKMAGAMTSFTAADVAAERLNNFNGKMEALRGTIETALIQSFSGILPALEPVVAGLTNALNGVNFEAVGKSLGETVAFLIQKLIETGPLLTTFFQNIQNFLTPVFTALGQAFNTFVLPALGMLQQAFMELLPSLQLLWQNIGPVLLPVLQILGTIIGTVIVGGVLLAIGAITLLIKGFTNLSNFISGVVGFITGVFNTISSTVSSFIGQVQSIWNTGVQAIQQYWENVWNTIKAFFGAIILTIAALFTGNTEQIGVIWGAFGEKLKTIWSGTWEAIKTFFGTAWESIKTMLSDLVTGTGQKMNEAGEAIKNAWNSAWEFIKNINVGEIASNIIDGFVNGIKNGASRVMNAMREMAQNAVKAAKDALDINSPSKVFTVIGQQTGQGMAIGIQNSTGGVMQASQNMANSAISGATGALAGIGTANFGVSSISTVATGQPQAQPIAPAVSQPAQPIASTAPAETTQADPSSLITPITESATGANEQIDSLIEKIKTGLSTAISEGAESIGEAILDMDEKTTEVFNMVNENWISISQAIGQNVINGIIQGLSAGERMVYSAIASLETNALKAVNIEVKAREEFGDEGRGAAMGIASVLNPNVQMIKGFKSARANGASSENNSKTINIGNITNNNNTDTQAMGQLINAFA